MKRYAAVLVPLLLLACSSPRTQFTSAATNPDSIFVLHEKRDVAAIEAAYHERVRLGLGSPFRVIEIAAYDERLSRATREALLEDLFERVLDGQTYELGATLPVAHIRLIEHALASTPDPRVAELAVNLAYEVARLEETISPELQYAAAATVALLRDRALAQHDARRVRAVARMHNQAAHRLVPAMRAHRGLQLEQPLMPALHSESEEAAARLALLLVGGVRHAARTPQAMVVQKNTSGLAKSTAERILALQRTNERPPQSALIISMRAAQLPYTARDEETFVAELALIGQDAALAAQRAAIALRVFAQENVEKDAHAPAATTFLRDFGITLRYRDDVPTAWRDFYARTLYDALADLRMAAPDLSLMGLTVEVGEVADRTRHLAYHDPRSRTIRWAPSTGAGSLAHEIAHDLDWQLARRSFGRSGYASDVMGDVVSMLQARAAESPDERATEVLARHFDWQVAAALARQGRLNGQLSSVQHDWLPGHGSARPPMVNSKSALALGQNDLPLTVRAVRALRQERAPVTAAGSGLLGDVVPAATSAYVDLAARSAGIIESPALLAEKRTTVAKRQDPKGSYLLWYY